MRRPSVRVRLLAPGKPARQDALRVFCLFVPSPRGWICRSFVVHLRRSSRRAALRDKPGQEPIAKHCYRPRTATRRPGPFSADFSGEPRPGPVAGMISQYRKMSKKGLTNAESGIIITIPHELNIHINFY